MQLIPMAYVQKAIIVLQAQEVLFHVPQALSIITLKELYFLNALAALQASFVQKVDYLYLKDYVLQVITV